MSAQPPPPNRVDVAIGIVVDNMSPDTDASASSSALIQTEDAEASTTRILITRRKAEQVLGGYWELPGGKVEPNESANDAVIRELAEEVGITVQTIATLDSVEHIYEHAHVNLIPFICIKTAGEPTAIQVDDVRWVRPDELDAYRFPEASLPVIEALRHWLDQHQNTLA